MSSQTVARKMRMFTLLLSAIGYFAGKLRCKSVSHFFRENLLGNSVNTHYNCVIFQNNMTTCDWDGLQCLANASDLLDSIRPVGMSMLASSTFGQGSLLGAECACPPACSKTRYTSTSSTAKFPNKASR